MSRASKKGRPGPAERGRQSAPRKPYSGGRQRIAAAAARLFFEEGLATGLERVLLEADASKPTFYHHYEGRTALEEEYLREQASELWSALTRIAERSRSPRQLITRWMDFVRRRARSTRFAGCPLGNFAVESAGRHKRAVGLAFEESVARLEESLLQTGLAPDRAAELSWSLFLIYEGSHLLARATGNLEHYARATRMMISLVSSPSHGRRLK